MNGVIQNGAKERNGCFVCFTVVRGCQLTVSPVGLGPSVNNVGSLTVISSVNAVRQ